MLLDPESYRKLGPSYTFTKILLRYKNHTGRKQNAVKETE
jgi:hypothetical protein